MWGMVWDIHPIPLLVWSYLLVQGLGFQKDPRWCGMQWESAPGCVWDTGVPVGSEMLPLGCWDLDLGSRLRTWGAGAKGLEPGSVWESLVFYGWYPEKGLKESGI